MKRTILVLCLLSVFALVAIGRISHSSTPGKASSDQLPSLQGCWQFQVNGTGGGDVVKFDPPTSADVYVGRYVSPVSSKSLIGRFEAHVLKNDGGTIFVPISYVGVSPGAGIGPPTDYLATFSGRYDSGVISGTWSWMRGVGANPNAGSPPKGSGDFTLTKLRKCPTP